MTLALDDVNCASLPLEAAPLLAALRTRDGLRVRADGSRLWLWWTAGDDEVLQCVLPLPGVELFARREGRWYRSGRRLPTRDVPDDAGAQPLLAVLAPIPVQPERVEGSVAPARLTVVRDDRPRPATALRCDRADLARWADAATSHQLGALQAARRGARVLVRGRPLPPLREGERFWGAAVLTLLGFRPEPLVPASVLCQALGLAEGDVALLTEAGAEVVPAGAFGPVTRAGVRLAARESD